MATIRSSGKDDRLFGYSACFLAVFDDEPVAHQLLDVSREALWYAMPCRHLGEMSGLVRFGK
jgi:hypothetical protein